MTRKIKIPTHDLTKPFGYRVVTNYYTRPYPDRKMRVSLYYSTIEAAWESYRHSVENLKAIDDPDSPPRVWFWEYKWDKDGNPVRGRTIAKNYSGGEEEEETNYN